MSRYIQITDNIITLIRHTQINSYEDGLQKINIIHHFIVEQINNQIHILKYLVNYNSNSDSDSDSEIDLNLRVELDEYEDLPDKPINDYESLVQVRNFYLSEQEYQHFNKLQESIIPLFKQTEIDYYSEYEIENLPELMKDIENKLNYIDKYHDDIETELCNTDMKIEVDKDSYDRYQTTYNILSYLYDMYSNLNC